MINDIGKRYNPPEKPDNLAKNEEKAVPLQANLQVYIPQKISKPFRINKVQ